MNKSKVKEIINFSFFQYFKNKWFVIFNVISLLTMVFSLNWSNISSFFSLDEGKDSYEIKVLDKDNLIYDLVNLSLSGDEKLTTTRIYENTYNKDNIEDDILILEIEKDDQEYFNATLISKEGLKTPTYDKIQNSLDIARNEYIKNEFSFSNDKLEKIQRKVELKRVMLAVDAENSDQKEIIKTISSFLTYMIAVLVFTRIANEIAQEKQSKSSEYVLTAVSGKEYLFAKVFSNIAILLIQMLLMLSYYMISVGILSLFKATSTDISLSQSMAISGLSIDIVIYLITLIVLNVLSFTLLSIIQGTLAAKTSNSQEAGNTVSILIFVMMALYVVTLFVIDPYTKVNAFLYIISVLPIFSAYFVPAMMIVGQASVIQILISVILLIISIPFVFNICGKAFKNGLLDYTKSKKKKKKKDLSHEEQLQIFVNKRKYSRLGLIAGMTIIIIITGQIISSLLFSLLIGPLLEGLVDKTTLNLITQMVLLILSLGVAFLFTKFFKGSNTKKEPLLEKYNIKKWQLAIIAFAGIYAFNLLLSLVIYPILGFDNNIVELFDVSTSSSIIVKILLFLSLALTPGIFEELLFRKGLIDLFSPYGRKFAIVLSALIFALIHLNISQGIFAFGAGLIFGLVYVLTNDIKITMIIHTLNNTMAVLALILPELFLIIPSVVVLVAVVVGVILFFKYMIKNKPFKDKNISFSKLKDNFSKKYKFLLYDFTFDVSVILIIVLCFLTENALKTILK